MHGLSGENDFFVGERQLILECIEENIAIKITYSQGIVMV